MFISSCLRAGAGEVTGDVGRLEARTATALSGSTGPSCPSTGLPHHQPLPSQPAAGRDGAELCPCAGQASPSLPLGQDRLPLTNQGGAPQGCSCAWGTVFVRTGLQVPSRAGGTWLPCRSRTAVPPPAAPLQSWAVPAGAAKLPSEVQQVLPHQHPAAPGGGGQGCLCRSTPPRCSTGGWRGSLGTCGSWAAGPAPGRVNSLPHLVQNTDTGAEMETASQQLRLKQENEYRNYVC